MTSICNYSHPELQLTDGLVRHNRGILFPYNPEFYKLASGLYGPGVILCWYLLIVSVAINWCCEEKDEDGNMRPGLSNDLLAVFAYPVFAATDLLVQGMKFLGTDYRALAIFCLRNSNMPLNGFATFNSTRLNLDQIPPDIVSLGQRTIEITGPLAVCYAFTWATILAFVAWSTVLGLEKLPLIPTVWVQRLTGLIYGYVVLILTIFHLSLGNIGISFFVSFYEVLVHFLLLFMFGYSGMILLGTIGGLSRMVVSLLKSDKKETMETLGNLGACLGVGVLPLPIMWLSVFNNRILVVPDLAIKVSDTDQLATLLGGIVTLGYTIGSSIRSKASNEGDREEMQALHADV